MTELSDKIRKNAMFFQGMKGSFDVLNGLCCFKKQFVFQDQRVKSSGDGSYLCVISSKHTDGRCKFTNCPHMLRVVKKRLGMEEV